MDIKERNAFSNPEIRVWASHAPKMQSEPLPVGNSNAGVSLAIVSRCIVKTAD